MDIILSTRNPGKTVQVHSIFEGSSISVRSLDDVGINGEAVEDALTIEENAMKKAMFAHVQRPEVWAMADDTGLFIHALDDAPGVHSARWAGDDVTTEDITAFTLRSLEGVQDRRATFRTVVAVVSPHGEEYIFNGEVEGRILESPRTPPVPKMPYSSIFVPEGEDRAWSEMTVEYVNSISHRGKAFALAKAFLEGK